MEVIKEQKKRIDAARLKERVRIIISLVLTPFVLFVITSVELYVKNRVDLDGRVIVIAPFFTLFFAFLAVGCLLYRFSSRNKYIKLALDGYYLLGPAFLVFSFVRQIQANDILKAFLLLIAFVAALFYLYRKLELPKMSNIFLWLSAIMVVGEALVVFNNFQAAGQSGQQEKAKIFKSSESAKKDIPNVYHIIFDEFQTDMFEMTLNDEAKKDLNGFVWYPNTATVYGRTGMSLPVIFTGQSYDYKQPQIEFQKQAFGSEKSLLYWLKKSGYETNALTHKIYRFKQDLFDSYIEHKDYAEVQLGDLEYIKTFLNLWTYANFPKALSYRLIDAESFDQIRAQNTLAKSTSAVNSESFSKLLKDEKFTKGSGQYFYVHLILPHFPYELGSDCSYGDKKETSPLDQAKCATKLMVDFIDTLKKNKNFDDSLIILQSDHGARFEKENNDLVKVEEGYYSEQWSKARSRSLLLIKAPDKKATEPLRVSNAISSLLDITPTVIDALDIETNLKTEGFSLLDEKKIPSDRLRYYHFFEKKGLNEFTDELSRYIIKDGEIKFDKKIKINENLDRAVKAEQKNK